MPKSKGKSGGILTDMSGSEVGKKRRNEPPQNPKKLKGKKSKHNQNSVQQEIRKGLASTKVRELLSMMKGGSPIVIEGSRTLYDALMILLKENIQSAPVYDAQKKEYLGFVDVVDLTTAVVEVAEQTGAFVKKPKSRTNEDDEDIEERLLMDSLDVKSVTDFSQREPYVRVYEDDSVLRAAETLVELNLHRLAIINQQGELTGVLTQSGLIEFISEEFAQLLDKDETEVKYLPDLPEMAFTVPTSARAIDAFKSMRDKKIGGIGVVDGSGRLVDVITAKDMVLWTEWIASGEVLRFTDLTSLTLNVEEFLENSRSQREIKRKQPIVCDEKTHIRDVISQMLVDNVHRLFLVDVHNKPISLVTFHHLLKHLIGKGRI